MGLSSGSSFACLGEKPFSKANLKLSMAWGGLVCKHANYSLVIV